MSDPAGMPQLFPGTPGPTADSSGPRQAAARRTQAEVHRRLLEAYGRPTPREVWDPLTQLIYSLCSSRTKTPESHAVLRNLRERYDGWPTGETSWSEVRWERLRDASVKEIEEAIQLATFADRKAPQLKSTLEQITQKTGALSLLFLADYRTEKIRAWLEQFPGIGSQVSSAIVNFSSLRRPVLSVDGHHQRVSIRLGLAPEHSTAKQVEEVLMSAVPPQWGAVMLDEHHQLVKALGQRACTPQNPLCRRCPLLELCPTGQARVKQARPAVSLPV